MRKTIEIRSTAIYRYEGSLTRDYFEDLDTTKGTMLKIYVSTINLKLTKEIKPGVLLPIRPSQNVTVSEDTISVKRSPYVDLWNNKFFINFTIPRRILSPYDDIKVVLRVTTVIASSTGFVETENPPRRTSYSMDVGTLLSSAIILLSKMVQLSGYQRLLVLVVSGYLKTEFDPYKLRIDIETWQDATPEQFYKFETYTADVNITLNLYSEQEAIKPKTLDVCTSWPTTGLETDDIIDISSLFRPSCSCLACH